jgi:TolB protein
VSSTAHRDQNGLAAVETGEPISVDDLVGRIVFDDFEDIYTMNADASDLRVVAGREGEEFDASWSPDGGFLAYRDSRRGINNDDEIYIVSADGTNPVNITNHPSNDWGPDWSPDGEWIAFNSDRDGGRPTGFLVRPDGSDLRPIEVEGWVEYISFSRDSQRIVYTSHGAGDFDIWIADLGSGERTRLTDADGGDGWPVWSPDGSMIAFSSQRDDCLRVPIEEDCWRSGDPGEHHDIWVMNADGSGQRRVSPETGQFVAWSPDGRFLLISGHTLFVVRPDGTGRVTIEPPDLPYPPGGIPDWTSEGP